MFIVRAENNQGLSIPSGISELARTLREGVEALAPHQLDEARGRLANRIVTFKDLKAASSTSVNVKWEVSCRHVLFAIPYPCLSYHRPSDAPPISSNNLSNPNITTEN